MPATAQKPSEQTREDQMPTRLMGIRAQSIDEPTRSFEVVAATENAVEVFDYERWEVIDEVLRMDGFELTDQLTLFEDHPRPMKVRDIRGSLRSIRVEGGQLIGRVFLDDGPNTEDAWRLIRNGHLRDVSVGYGIREAAAMIAPNQRAVVGGREYVAGKKHLRIATKWFGRELSLTPKGADGSAKIREDSAHKEGLNMTTSVVSGEAPGAEIANPAVHSGASAVVRGDAGEAAVVAALSKASGEAEMERLLREGAAMERARIKSIDDYCGDDHALAAKARSGGWTLQQTKDAMLEQFRSGRSPSVKQTAPVYGPEQKLAEDLRALAAGFALSRGDTPIDPKAPAHERKQQEDDCERGYKYRMADFTDIIKEGLKLRGLPVGFDRSDNFRSAVSTGLAADLFTTSINARIMAAFATHGNTCGPLVTEVDVDDFLANDRIGFEGAGRLQKLASGDAAKHRKIPDTLKESYKIARYADMLGIDEQEAINGRLYNLYEYINQCVESAAKLIPDLVYSVYLKNAALNQDNKALFHVDHGNLATGGASALSKTSLQARMTAIRNRTRTGPGNHVEPLDLRAKFLLYPPDLHFVAKQLVESEYVMTSEALTSGGVQIGTSNPLYGEGMVRIEETRLGPAGVTDPVDGQRLTGTATNWFLQTMPGRTIEVGYLKSSQGRRPRVLPCPPPTGMFGQFWTINFDAGAKALAFETMDKSAGA